MTMKTAEKAVDVLDKGISCKSSVEELAQVVSVCLTLSSNLRRTRKVRERAKAKLSEIFVLSSEGGVFKALIASLATKGVKIGDIALFMSGIQLWTIVLMSAEVAGAALQQIQARNPILSEKERKEVLARIPLLDKTSRERARALCLRAPVAA